MKKPIPPQIDGTLRKITLPLPEVIWKCSGIVVFGRRIKSFVFTTDLAIIRNVNADAILAVYPFTAQPIIYQALMLAAEIPVFTGVGGGVTTGRRVVDLASHSEMLGASGVVLNAPSTPETIHAVAEKVDVPVVVSVARWSEMLFKQIEAGAQIVNVAAAGDTPEIVRKLREKYPTLPIMASGGPTDQSILQTIEAGANAITWTPPSTKDLLGELMADYRDGESHHS